MTNSTDSLSSILPPSTRVWWNQPLDRIEGTWIALALIWCLAMFFMMPYWHIFGKQNLWRAAMSASSISPARAGSAVSGGVYTAASGHILF